MRFKLTKTSDKFDSTMMITVEPKTVDDLMVIANRYGSIIIHPSMDWKVCGGKATSFPEIEIYDDWRE